MGQVGFGQPDDGIIQMAYTGIDPVYRGQPSRAQISLAMSFAGHMNIELIQAERRIPCARSFEHGLR